jgi:hypothetical protein
LRVDKYNVKIMAWRELEEKSCGGCFFFILQHLPSSHAFQYWHASRLKLMVHMLKLWNTWSMGPWSMPVFKQGITNMLALPVDKMLYITL